jgi:hypothetical protein
LDDIEHLP